MGGEGFLIGTSGSFFELTQGVEEARKLEVTGLGHVAGYEIRPFLQVVPILADVLVSA